MGRKYVVLVGDGMADYPIKEGKTPIQMAHTPNMDRIAAGRMGLVRTIPHGMEPGSDVANLAILGYDPRLYHTGRAPLEAASHGIILKAHERAFRMNLVSLEFVGDGRIKMQSHSAGDITQEEGLEIVSYLKGVIKGKDIRMYPGVAYRHLLIWENAPDGLSSIPPHDYLGEEVQGLMKRPQDRPMWDLVRASWPLLEAHRVNKQRIALGKLPANSIWLWGHGKVPELPSFKERYGIQGGVISAVDLIRGIGTTLGLKVIHVPGATGYLDSNLKGKADAAVLGLKELDLILVHVEAPDEASHEGSLPKKIKAIELFDREVVGRVLSGLRSFEDYRVLVISDHLTPILKRTHTDDPTVFAWADKVTLEGESKGSFSEEEARRSGLFFEKGDELMGAFVGK